MLTSLVLASLVWAAPPRRGTWTDTISAGVGRTWEEPEDSTALVLRWRHALGRTALTTQVAAGLKGHGDAQVGLDLALVGSPLHGLSVGPRLAGGYDRMDTELVGARFEVEDRATLLGAGVGGALTAQHIFEPGYPTVGLSLEGLYIVAQEPWVADRTQVRLSVDLGGALGRPGTHPGPLHERAPWVRPVVVTGLVLGGLGLGAWRVYAGLQGAFGY